MKTRVINLGQLCLSLIFCLGLSACNKDEFFQKDYLGAPSDVPAADGSANGGSQGGTNGADGDAHGGVSSGVDGSTTGSATTGSSTDGSSTGGSTVGGTATTGSSNGGTSSGGTSSGGSTVGGTTVGGSSSGGATVGGSTGGSSTGSTTAGSTVGGSSTGGSTTGTVPSGVGVTENFKQAEEEMRKLDIVWIVDNSGSMKNDQDALAANFDSFIRGFISREIDFQMAITTTDVDHSSTRGKMVSNSSSLLNSQAAAANPTKFISDFKRMIKVGTDGSGAEKGLEASEWFMNRYAQSYVRPGAYLAVVILSDEEDSSPKAVSYYTDLLKSHKIEQGLVKVYSIVDVTRSNTQSGITQGYERYALASSNTAGTTSDIRHEFSTVLTDIGDSLINLLDSFALAHHPVAGSLKVYVNDTLVTDFTYDNESHSIKFNDGSVPPVGADIKVTYLK